MGRLRAVDELVIGMYWMLGRQWSLKYQTVSIKCGFLDKRFQWVQRILK